MSGLVDLRQGQIFASKYRIERLLKAGGMGAVYEVRHTQNHKRWALKIMHGALGSDPGARERFVREAQIDGVIGSSHVVSVVDAGVDETSGTPYLVMEFLVGEELGDLLRRVGRMSAAAIVPLMQQLARALDKAHSKGIIHRDLKPENLFITHSDEEGERLKVLDFGIAKVLEAGDRSSTQAGGTPLYMAPEQTKKGRDIGPWTDVWAMGLIAYTLLVGRSYWEAQSVGELYGELLDTAVREPASRRASRAGAALPPSFDGWFSRCVDNDPHKRFGSAGQAVLELAIALGVPADAPRLRISAKTPFGDFGSDSVTHVSPKIASQLRPSSSPQKGVSAEPLPTSAATDGTLATTERAPIAGLPTTATPVSESLSPRRTAPLTRGDRRFGLYLAGGTLVVVGAVTALVATFRGSPRMGTTGRMIDAGPPATSSPAEEDISARSKRGEAASLRVQVDASNPFVHVRGLAVERHEITRAEYALFLARQSEEVRGHLQPLSDWVLPNAADRSRRPVTWVPHQRAALFCSAIEARLPTTEEWTIIAGTTLPGAGTSWPPAMISTVAVSRGESAQPVDVESSSGDVIDGISDLFGNVKEWTATVQDGFAVIRGADIATSLDDARTALSTTTQKLDDDGGGGGPQALAGPRLGFRCVR